MPSMLLTLVVDGTVGVFVCDSQLVLRAFGHNADFLAYGSGVMVANGSFGCTICLWWFR